MFLPSRSSMNFLLHNRIIFETSYHGLMSSCGSYQFRNPCYISFCSALREKSYMSLSSVVFWHTWLARTLPRILVYGGLRESRTCSEAPSWFFLQYICLVEKFCATKHRFCQPILYRLFCYFIEAWRKDAKAVHNFAA